jgi:hypothetical protein
LRHVCRSGKPLLASAGATLVSYVYFADQKALTGPSPKRGCQCTKDQTHCSRACTNGTAFGGTFADFTRLRGSLIRRRLLSLRCRLVGARSRLRR